LIEGQRIESKDRRDANGQKQGEKSVVEKTLDVVKEFAATVSEVAHRAIESKTEKSDDEIHKMPTTSTDFADDAVATPVVVRKKRKTRKTRAKRTKTAAKKTARRNIKKAESRARKSSSKKTERSKKTKR
jgi:hypothetical protein